jgi:DNA-binding NarL/FixJ family response regulator
MTTRVLLVDDVPDVRRLVRTTLRLRGGFEVVAEASDGAEATRMAGRHHPDVVVLDLGLPDIAGQDLLTALRQSSPTSKIVVFSGMETDREIADQVEGYVLKDAEVGYLADLLESIAEQPQTVAATLDLPQSLISARTARQFVGQKLAEWALDDLVDDALLIASELAANAITHAASPCRIRLALTPSTLRIDVLDTGAGTPEPQPPSSTEEHGRGLHLIDALTTAWGLEVLPDGKMVWAELARPRAAPTT